MAQWAVASHSALPLSVTTKQQEGGKSQGEAFIPGRFKASESIPFVQPLYICFQCITRLR